MSAEQGEYHYTTPDGVLIYIPTAQWSLRKSLVLDGGVRVVDMDTESAAGKEDV